MEQFNRIEIQGIVGNVRVSVANEKTMARFGVVTSRAYKNMEGAPVIDTMWHNVVAFEGRDIRDLTLLQKGSKVYVKGRMRVSRIVGQDGIERDYYDILATNLKIYDDSETLECEI